MKTILLLLSSFLISLNVSGQDVLNTTSEDETILIFTRHAEKSDSNTSDPNLSQEGHKRAEKLSVLLQRFEDLNAIYSTDYNRTRQTAEPVAKSFDKSISIYDPRKLDKFKSKLLSDHSSETVLIVGHSNTTPTLINLVMGEERLQQFDEEDYSNLYIIKMLNGKSPVLKHYKY